MFTLDTFTVIAWLFFIGAFIFTWIYVSRVEQTELKDKRKAGYMNIIHTTRNNTPALRDFLNKNRIYFDYINENPYQPKGSEYGKVKADVYLDDRSFCFTENWNDALNQIFNFKTRQQDYWK